MRDVSLAVHVVAAIAGFGATFTYPFIERAGARGGAAQLAQAYRTILLISRRLAVPAALVVGLTGVHLTADGPYDLGDAWIAASVVLYVLVMAVATGVVAPAYARAERAAAAGAEAELRRARRVISAVGPVLALAIVAIAVLMEIKP